MTIDEKIEKAQKELRELEELKLKEQKQSYVNDTNKFSIHCSCGAIQSVDEYSHSEHNINIDGDMGCIVYLTCKKCGKKWKRNFWC